MRDDDRRARVYTARVIPYVFALALGLALAPVLLVFPPLYFPATLLLAACAGMLVGVAGGGEPRRDLIRTAAAVVVVFVIAVGALVGLRSVGPTLFLTAWWLLIPVGAGALLASVARRRYRRWRSLGLSALTAALLAAAGAAAAVAAAPAEVAGAEERDRCWMIAERRRFLAIERVTEHNAQLTRCVYTAWGGVHIGTASFGERRGGDWEDGWWPRLFLPAVR